MQVQRFEDFAEEAESKSSKFKFAFIEGPLVRAIRNGDWVLLDEINLATSETLESLSTLLQSSTSSLVLTERGDLEPVQRHPDFRLFACMNPANDVGKRDLPPALRSKLTEIYVQAPDTDKEVLHSVIHGYIGHVTTGDKGLISDVAESYLSLKGLAQGGKIADGSNHPPHFSMRTLARALLFAADFASEFGARRAVYEGIAMCFTTSLDASSRDAVLAVMQEKIVDRSKSPRSFFKAIMSPPTRVQDYVSVGSFWLAKGSVSPEAMDDYVLTPSVEDKLINLTRAVAAARFPILLQGPTSSGKTSIIEYLAKRSGHRFVRINNHEHTDIQEYLGTYVSDPDTGKLVFQEGLLVTAVRQGHWIVLDELNLAPSDVLEALNRLLDDNRELVVPETQEVVKPHPHFMLFATQNPPGLYGGRKVLSRAFRNRFLEMQFSDVPQDELETILCQRCKIAPSYAKKIVAVFLELQRRRQGTRLFEEKQAFVTLRDLFRWGNRGAVGYDQLALDGYMLLAERTRQEADKQTVKEVIEQIMRVSLSPESAYREVFVRLQSSDHLTTKELVWTTAMKRLYVLLRTALSFNEPVLLVGETGSGKTSICQAVARALGQKLHIVNCHQNTETSDLIGSQRPVRNKKALQEGLRVEALSYLSHRNIAVPEDTSFDALQAYFTSNIEDSVDSQGLLKRMKEADALFTWRDGPLIDAMRRGELLLLDEISLADDSVLERLNSVLEPARTLTVAEKGSDSAQDLVVRANQSFQFIGTMNPGGDFGKKELSPALRNRFTEVWVPWLSENDDILGILRARLHEANAFAEDMLVFVKWFTEQIRPREKYSFGSVVTLRDLLAWADFIVAYNGDTREGFIHGALMTLVDSLGSASSSAGFSKSTIASVRDRTISFLTQLVSRGEQDDQFQRTSGWTGTEAFEQFLNTVAARGEQLGEDWHFSLTAPTVRQNALRVLRALQVSKPVLLEGSPGVGKTSLVTALARITKHRLCRINLSDQTDLVDLFGNDAPVEGGQAGEFAWVEAPFLAAMQSGDWVLLDEMNLASQSVLEGLNSCLDHRGTVYIPELDKVFVKHPDFRLFAAQNPTHQGGSRKGLPRSFVDRFTQVYMDDLNGEDYVQICHQLYPTIEEPVLRNMVNFVTSLANEVLVSTSNFQSGAPWEVNLRDLLRWLSMMHSTTGYERFPGRPVEYLDHLFLQRFRQVADRQRVLLFYEGLFGKQPLLTRPGRPVSTSTTVRIGRNIIMSRDLYLKEADISPGKEAHSPLRALEAIASSLACNQLLILTGRSGSGKSKLIQDFSTMTGRKVRTFYANAQTDTLEMLGTFEQCSQSRQQAVRFEEMQAAVDHAGADQTDVDGWHMHRRTALLLSRLRLAASSLPPDPPMIQRLLSDLQEVCEGKNGLESAFQSLSDALRSTNHPRAATAGKFEFVDGVLIQAMKAGDILVVENANRCSSAVLDRLNGLFEPGGTLFLGERGLTADGRVPEVKPHPDFRVIMTVDPSAGELSRAMRNRGVEIALLDDPRKPSSSCVSGYLTCSIINAREQAVTPSLRKHLQLPKDVLVRTHLLHTLGSQRLTSLAYWLDAIDAEPPLKALLKDVVQHLASSALSSIRPGAVTGDLPGQSHLVRTSVLIYRAPASTVL